MNTLLTVVSLVVYGIACYFLGRRNGQISAYKEALEMLDRIKEAINNGVSDLHSEEDL